MENVHNIFIIFVSAVITGTITLRLLFKNSIFLRIGTVWAINIFLTVINSKVHYSFPQAYPMPLALTVGLSFTAAMLYFVYINVRKPLLHFIEIIKVVSTGDFSAINENNKSYSGEIKELNIQIKKLTEMLRGSVSQINHSSVSVDKMGHSTNTMAKSLSSGSADQASAIEEISASIEEINANIESAFINSEKSKQHTLDTNNKLQASNDSALKLVSAMESINEKIKIIDHIANQTNLLALNASIEAKQAGVAGKGFSVVAGEVRLLAEHSKMAAEEINNLTEKGIVLSEEVSKNLKMTIPSMDNTINLIAEISVSSKELKSGSDQITGAMHDINQNTQANAKLAEEMSVNSDRLSIESEKLLKNVEFFKI